MSRSLFIGMYSSRIIIACKNSCIKLKVKLLLTKIKGKKNISKNLLYILIYSKLKRIPFKSLNIPYRGIKNNDSLIKCSLLLVHLRLKPYRNKINCNFWKRVHKIRYSKSEKNPMLKWYLCLHRQPNRISKKELSRL